MTYAITYTLTTDPPRLNYGRIWYRVFRDWLPNSLRSYFRVTLDKDVDWLDKLGQKEFWPELVFAPYFPLVFIIAALIMLERSDLIAEHMSAEAV